MVSAVSGTNLDVNTLVTQLMQAERAPLAAMQRTQNGFQAKISAYGRLQSSMSTLSDAVRKLDSSDTFRAASAKVSDASVLGATASAGAAAGSYSIEVQALAQAQKLASAAFGAADSVVGSGNLTIQFGTYASGPNTFTVNPAKAALNVVIDAGNNTLEGVRDAINTASGTTGGVRASIINDGSGFRLAISPSDGGVANSLKIAVADDDLGNTDLSGLSRLAFNPTAANGAGKNLTQNVAAQDALLYIDGVQVRKSSNTITDAISGLSMNLAKTNTGSPITLTVAPDADAMKTTINGFVTAYNGFNSQVRLLTFYDAGNKTAGALQGDATVRGVQGQVKAQITQALSGLTGGITRLSDIGLTFQRDGALAFDSVKFQKAVDGNSADLAALFTVRGNSTDSRVQFSGAPDTLATGAFSVAVTTAATQGRMTGGGVAGLTIVSGVNDTLNLTVDGQAVSVTLAAATYASTDALAAEMQSKINGDAGLKNLGGSVTASQSAGVLQLRSARFSGTSSVTGATGSAALTLFGAAPVSSAGSDVAGTINGIAASGSGQTLVSPDGLRLKVAPDASGALGNVSFTRGYGALLRINLTKLADTGGPLSSRTEGLNASIKRNTRQQESFNARMTTLEATYRRQFSALDTMLSRMSTTSNFLTQQLAQLNYKR